MCSTHTFVNYEKGVLLFLLLLLYLHQGNGVSYRQEGAILKYANPKYLSNVTVFTSRAKRGEPYRTNVTFVTLYPLNNNVTLEIGLKTKSDNHMLTLDIKLCDMFKWAWIVDFIKAFSQYKLNKCPFPAQWYEFINVEFPPKNSPLEIPKGEAVILTIRFYVTKTLERVSEGMVVLRNN